MVLVNHWTAHFSLWSGQASISPLWDFLGDAGVGLFFALSGFLIGRILLDMRAGWRDLRIFLTRRALRTLPLYFLWLTLLLAVFPPAGGVAAIGPRYATLTQNLIAPMPANFYFAVSWSLAVEEWFYLLSGIAIVGLSLLLGRRRAVWCYLALFLLAPMAARFLHDDWRALVPFRLDEIAYGVLFASLYRAESALFRHPWFALGGGLSLVAFAAFGLPSLLGSWSAYLTGEIVAIGFALCLPAALRARRAPAWFAAPVAWIGTRSYALYIVHLTVLVDIVEVRLFEPGLMSLPLSMILAIVLPFGLAELSWRFVETPMLRLRPRHDTRTRTGRTQRVTLPAATVPASA